MAQIEQVRFLFFHYTAVDNSTSLKLLSGQNVSGHYLISDRADSRTREPIVYRLVSEERRTWHARVSNWNGRLNLNDSSIGIEIMNPGLTEGMLGHKSWYPYCQRQINALKTLAREIIRRYKISLDTVLGHSHIAPLRKQEPGRLLQWKALAEQGAWPVLLLVQKYLAGRAPDVLSVQTLLRRYGYALNGGLDDDTRKLSARFRCISGRKTSTAHPMQKPGPLHRRSMINTAQPRNESAAFIRPIGLSDLPVTSRMRLPDSRTLVTALPPDGPGSLNSEERLQMKRPVLAVSKSGLMSRNEHESQAATEMNVSAVKLHLRKRVNIACSEVVKLVRLAGGYGPAASDSTGSEVSPEEQA